MELKLIVGLGNPGEKYTKTRHNAGFWWLDAIANKFQVNFTNNKKFFSAIAEFNFNNNKVILAKPQTFMNNSGKAVLALASFYNIECSSILVAHDELDLPAGQLRLKSSGGHAGHNGLQDIIQCLNNKDFHRLRIGIGHPGDKAKVLSFVLKTANKIEQDLIDKKINSSLNCIEDLIAGKFTVVMNELHQK